jgi:uncharacterized protein YpmS
MSDADTSALIERLQRSNRRWKWLALSLLATLGLVVLLVTTSTVVFWVKVERERRQAQAAQEQARKQVEDARERARRAVDEALKKADKVCQQ